LTESLTIDAEEDKRTSASIQNAIEFDPGACPDQMPPPGLRYHLYPGKVRVRLRGGLFTIGLELLGQELWLGLGPGLESLLGFRVMASAKVGVDGYGFGVRLELRLGPKGHVSAMVISGEEWMCGRGANVLHPARARATRCRD